MKPSLLPRIQLILVVVFALTALFGPLFVRQMNTLVGLVLAVGGLLGLLTLWIGWLAVRNKAVEYPFRAWSLVIMKPFLSPQQLRQLQKKKQSAAGRTAVAIGIANMVVGVVLVAALVTATILLNQ